MEPTALDHVALWVADRDPLADFLCEHAGMHVVDRTDAFTLVGSDARRGKLTLFAAEGPRDPGALERVVLRVSDLERALAALPSGLAVERQRRRRHLRGAGGPRPGSGRGDRHRRRVRHRPRGAARPRPARARVKAWRRSACAGGRRPAHGRRQARAPRVRTRRAETDRPLLNHIALLVDSGQEHLDEARDRGIEIAEVRDAANTFAFFVWGPDGIQLEYVEHKPEFSLT